MPDMNVYSPFFNSGLHARRSSLPSRSSSSNKSTSAYYRSLQRRDADEHRSFLSLDLAESRLSERHLPQPAISCLIPPVPALPPLPAVSPLKSLFSTSPKPAPDIMLPDLPPPYSIHHTHQRSPPRLPELPVLPAFHCPLPPKPRQRPLPSPPSPTEDDLPDPRSSVLTKPKHLRAKKPKNLSITTNPDPNRLSKASVSTASTRVRRRNRWDALDALEGRRKPSTSTDLPFLPPQKKKKSHKLENVFVNPATFAKPIHLLRPRRALPNFMSMSDDSDPEPTHSSASNSTLDLHDLPPRVYMNQNLPLDVDPLLEPEDIVLPSAPAPSRPRHPFALSYLDVEEEEEGVVLEATRCPAPSSPPPPTIIAPRPRVKGPVDRPKPSTKLPPQSSSNHHHNPSTSSSRQHKPSRPRNNHSHYKSFIELDMDDLVEPVKPNPKRSDDSIFEWRGRVGRGIAEGGGEWVWV